MFKKLLIANRGEIACRVAKSAHRLGIKTVGVYSEADKYAQHPKQVDQAFLVGPAPAAQSYLKVPHLLEVAKYTKSQAIHPGYGFLSENADFVELIESKGLTFVGPPASAIRKMGSKSESKKIMEAAGVPILQGYHGDNQDPEFLLQKSRDIGFPVMLKASLGGGGKGMRIVHTEAEFMDQLDAAKREAMKGFNDDHMIVEKYVVHPRHIEVQVFGDKHGNYVHMYERDCTVQRRHQKIIEEAPSQISPALRAHMGETAIAAANAVGYYNAGTVEFIFDTDTDKFYFMEMNTRLQVEHPVSEMITGLDLVEWQIRVASGQKLPILKQENIPLVGHSLEARIYAESPEKEFLPQSGKINVLREPIQIPGKIRVDTGVKEGDEISTFYDPMISKLIVHAATRQGAIEALDMALEDYHVIGLPTNIKFLRRTLAVPQFQEGNFDTSFIEQHEETLLRAPRKNSHFRRGTIAIVKVFLETLRMRSKRRSYLDPWQQRDMFRMNHKSLRPVELIDDEGNTDIIEVEYLKENTFNAYYRDENGFLVSILLNAQIELNPDRPDDLIVRTESETFKVDYYMDGQDNVTQLDYEGAPLNISVKPKKLITEEDAEDAGGQSASASVISPMPGRVVKIFVQPGQEVKKGENLISVESMKMEYFMKATRDGVINNIKVKEGDAVAMKQELATFVKEMVAAAE